MSYKDRESGGTCRSQIEAQRNYACRLGRVGWNLERRGTRTEPAKVTRVDREAWRAARGPTTGDVAQPSPCRAWGIPEWWSPLAQIGPGGPELASRLVDLSDRATPGLVLWRRRRSVTPDQTSLTTRSRPSRPCALVDIGRECEAASAALAAGPQLLRYQRLLVR